MNIPYFSLITTPGQMVVWCLTLIFVGCLSGMASLVATDYKKSPSKLEISLWIIIAILGYIFLTWIFIGDSVSWSKSIGLWLQGK